MRVGPIGNGGCNERCTNWSKETTEEAFAMLLERHLDLKNFFQLSQDLEIIRRVVFSQRHIVLSPLITLEAEKRAVDLLNKDKNLVKSFGTMISKSIGRFDTDPLDINENEDVAPTHDGRDRIFGEQSSIGMMLRQKMKASG